MVVVLPFPAETEDQILLSKPEFSLESANPEIDEIYGNKYVLFDIALEPGEQKSLTETFDIERSPALIGHFKRYSFKDYIKLDKKIIKTYCAGNKYIDSTYKGIVDLAKKIKGGSDNVLETVRAINRYLVRFLVYKNPILGLYTAKQAFDTKQVDCGGFDTLFVALCIACGVPARIVSGFWAGYEDNQMHAWAEFLLPDGLWVPVDPSIQHLFSRGKTRKSGRFGFVGSDRVSFSVGCDIPIRINKNKVFTDILQNAFLYPENKDNSVAVSIKFITKIL